MMFFARKKADAPQAPMQDTVKAADQHMIRPLKTPSSDCAIWNDITRALDLKSGEAK